jgi:hypothetical protein
LDSTVTRGEEARRIREISAENILESRAVLRKILTSRLPNLTSNYVVTNCIKHLMPNDL